MTLQSAFESLLLENQDRGQKAIDYLLYALVHTVAKSTMALYHMQLPMHGPFFAIYVDKPHVMVHLELLQVHGN